VRSKYASRHSLDIGGSTYTRVLHFGRYFSYKDGGSTCVRIDLYTSIYGIFSFIFTVLVVHPHHDHPVTTVLTQSTLLWHDIALLKVALNTNQTNKRV